MAEKMVNVKISGTMEVRYNKTVKMSQGEFDRLSDALGEDFDSEAASEQIQDYLDLTDIDDSETIELDTFEIVK
jgi:hypothetical protein